MRNAMMCRSWIRRRVVWTIDYIFISRVGEEDVIDFIAFSEADTITCNEELNTTHESKEKAMVEGGLEKDQTASMSRRIVPEDTAYFSNKNINNSKVRRSILRSGSVRSMQDLRADDTKQTKGKIVLKITTAPEGFNSGQCRCIICPNQYL
jgi:hypothetical protein